LHTQSKFRLLVVRLGAMGDILHALPAVTALRRAHPGWVIDWVVEPKWRLMLATDTANGRDTGSAAPLQPVVDRLHFAPTRLWRTAPLAKETRDAIRALRRDLKDGAYDAVIDLQGALRSSLIARLAGSPRRIGEAAPREGPARFFFTEWITTRGAHVIEQDLELAAAIAGDDLQYTAPLLPFDPTAEAWAAELFSRTPRAPHVLINPGAGWGAKRWPVERYAAAAQGLIGRGCRVLVNAGPGEEALSDTIVKATGGAAVPLFASLEHLIAVTRRIALLIAGDTGPLHLACALSKPVVGIYGPTDPSRNGPFGTRYRVLRNPASVRDHSRIETPEAGLLTIQPDEVLQAADELLYSEATE
jgi:heptosyltransferase-1